MILKKWGKWSVNTKKLCKRGRKPKLIVIKDDLRGAKRPPDWLMELQDFLAEDAVGVIDNDKTA